MANIQDQLRKDWAARLPELPNDWPYWWIEGDGYLLAVIEGGNLSAAIEVIEDYWTQYSSIFATTARTLDKDLVRGQHGVRKEICNRALTKQQIDNRPKSSPDERDLHRDGGIQS